ncbi:MAG: hypothetical protein PHI06_05940 [Desulfobulbaceae bacterium]|nr:hypothetical protein [Desulfobulbaceae bacterium]
MPDFLNRAIEWIHQTQVLEQIQAVDVSGLFHNPYFLAPFICVIIYNLYRQTFTNLIIIAIGLGLWYFSGTDYVRGAVIDGQVQISKIIPLAGVGIGSIGVLVYLLFIRQD